MVVMSVRFARPQEVESWNDYVNANPDGGNILQGREFIEQKALAGWTPRYIFVDDRAIAVIEKSIPLLGKVWYCPKGPSTTSVSDLKWVLEELVPFAKKQQVFSVKIEPELDHTTDMSGLSLIPTAPIQYNYSTVYVDLSPSLDDILMSLNQKGRHAIRRAERDGVTVEAVPASDENCQIMYDLFLETAGGAGFAIRPPEYYRSFYRAYESKGNGQLFFAYFEARVVAGAFAMVQGKKSMYKDGASVRERTAYGASHLLQWHVVEWAKQKGSLLHDLAGVPPIDQIKNPDHPFSGLARFKTSFNKEVTQYVGAFEVPVVTWKAKLWHRIVEKVVRRLYFKRHHESYY
jgi:lipid II:glycine glycyltransferase (peptidoglycan interpeptide bridge formation enzyme)